MKQKIIGRAAALALAVVLCITACFTAFAEGKTYTVKECDDLQITLPDNMAAVTRSSAADDRFFTLHGLDYNQVMTAFQSGNIYLQAMDDVEAATVTLSYLENEQSKGIGNYNKLSGSELQQIAQNFIAASGSDVSYNSATLDQAESSAVWIYFNMGVKAADGKNYTQYQASTVYNGKNISVTYYRNGGDVTADDYNILTGIVNSVKFGGDQNFFANLLSMGNMKLYIIIGCVVLAIILLIIILVIVSRSKKRKKKSKNDQILQELAGKYQTNRSNAGYADDKYDELQQRSYEEAPQQSYNYDEEPAQQDISSKYVIDDEFDDYDDGITRKYSDEDIARLLGDDKNDENFNDALPATKADFEELSEVRDSVVEENGVVSDSFLSKAETAAPEAAEEPALTAYNKDAAEDFFDDYRMEEEPAKPAETEVAAADSDERDVLLRADGLLLALGLMDEPEPEAEPEKAPAEEAAEEEPEEISVEETEEASAEEPAPVLEDEAVEDDFFDDSRMEEEVIEDPEETPFDIEAELPEDFEDEQDVLQRANDLLADFGLLDEPEEVPENTIEETPEEVPEEEPAEPVFEENVTEEPAEPEKDVEAEPETELEAESPAEESAGENPEDEVSGEEETDDDFEDEEFAEYANDEVLVREESNQERFKNSNDFFEEAPKKAFGVISREEIAEAEEYDVIGEVEHRAEKIEQEPPKKKGEGFGNVMKKIGGGLKTFGGGIKNFGVHCGYFATNVRRAVKRKRAIKKRKKAEEERRRKQMERRQQQRAVQQRQRDKNGLVQVRSRGANRPGNNKNR